ncbi:hypothetical protein TNCV_3896051 [Trichonephila clavipes]|nr:hypothetical protein TNCV_3896051 [Trichonephila clavipes]
MILVESSPGEKMELAFLSFTQIDRFGGKGILVCGGMLGSRTTLCQLMWSWKPMSGQLFRLGTLGTCLG